MPGTATALEHLLLLVVGIAGLWTGTHLVVGNSVRLARRFQVSDLFLGLTLLALGTDLPELLVAVDGALHNLRGIESSGVVVGTAGGSSVGQISIVIGLTALLHYLTIGGRQLRLLGVELVGSCALLFLLAKDGSLTRVDGLVLSLVFLLYMGFTVANRSVGAEDVEVVGPEGESSAWRSAGLLLLGLAVVVLSSELTVDKALELASDWGLQQSFVGAVLVGIWTVAADVYASALLLLALSGIFLVRGRKGLKGRGGLLMTSGFLLPIVYAFVMRG